MNQPVTKDGPASLHTAIGQVLSESATDAWGKVSAGDYDTAHMVRAWARRPGSVPEPMAQAGLSFLLAGQNADGSWGSAFTPASYRLVPTLAATAGLLAVAVRVAPGRVADRVGSGQDAGRAAAAADRGLRFLCQPAGSVDLPDTVAIEFIVPALIQEIMLTLAAVPLDATAASPPTAASPATAALRTQWLGPVSQLLTRHDPLHIRLQALRTAAAAGAPIPAQLLFSAEVLDRPPAQWPELFTEGHTGCSPAATAAALAWTGSPPQAAIDYLARAAGRGGSGALPHFLPMATFERSWIVANMARLGLRPGDPLAGQLAAYFTSVLENGAVPMGPGLPADADITSVMLFALHSLGGHADPGCLLDFEGEHAFVNYPSERTASTTTNAHILEALTAWCEASPGCDARYHSGRAKARRYLLATQRADGSWADKWHASPYYATNCAALALSHCADAPAQDASLRALRWILATQRDDGAWGQWLPTLDETAHALQLMLCLAPAGPGYLPCGEAIRRGCAFLTAARQPPPADPARMPLWHSKELYEPERIVHALTLSVRAAAARHTLPEQRRLRPTRAE
jgi:halimadienyl-diphosphate synthase